jgi:hypothetical protein
LVGYRIVEIKNNKVFSLFHATNGSREIPLDRWYRDEGNLLVRDGSGGKYYMAGWHFLKSKDDAVSFLERMFRIRTNRYVVKCHVRGNIRPKEHSTKGKCWLADEIMIKSEDLWGYDWDIVIGGLDNYGHVGD